MLSTVGLHLHTICDILGSVKLKWFQFGIQLGIPRKILLSFRTEEDPLSTVVDYWMKGKGMAPISWNSIVKALKSEHIGKPELAEKISKKYYQQGQTLIFEVFMYCNDFVLYK